MKRTAVGVLWAIGAMSLAASADEPAMEYDFSAVKGLTVSLNVTSEGGSAQAAAFVKSPGDCPYRVAVTIEAKVRRFVSTYEGGTGDYDPVTGEPIGGGGYTVNGWDWITINQLTVLASVASDDNGTLVRQRTVFIELGGEKGHKITLKYAADVGGDEGEVYATIKDIRLVPSDGGCSGSGCSGAASGAAGLNSAGAPSISLPVGVSAGQFGGALSIDYPTPGESLGAIVGVGFSGVNTNTEVIKTDFQGNILTFDVYGQPVDQDDNQITVETQLVRQVKSSQALMDVVVLASTQYVVNCYYLNQVGSKVDGLYSVTGTPYKSWSVLGINTQQLNVTEIVGAREVLFQYQWDAQQQGWSLASGNGLKTERTLVATNATSGDITKTYIVQAGTNVQFKSESIYHAFAWGTELIERSVDPDGANRRTVYGYCATTNDTNAYSRLAMKIEPSGYWERYEYDDLGRPVKTVAQFLDAPTNAAESACRVMSTSYLTIGNVRIRAESVHLLGTPIRKVEYATDSSVSSAVLDSNVVFHGASASRDSVSNLTTKTTRSESNGAGAGEVRKIEREDGTGTRYSYVTNGTSRIVVASSGAWEDSYFFKLINGTETSTTYDPAGAVLGEEIKDYGWFWGDPVLETDLTVVSNLLSSKVASTFDDLGRVTRYNYDDNTYELMSYGCCGLDSIRDREGIWTTFQYDALNRQTTVSRAGIGQDSAYDALGRTVEVSRRGADNSAIVQERTTYDTAGQVVARTNALGQVTSYSEDIDASTGHKVRTVVYPDGSTRIEEYYQDGQLYEVRGTAERGIRYEYGVESDGLFTKEIRLNASGAASSEWVKRYVDFVGRQYLTRYPDNAAARTYYNLRGQVRKSVDPDGVVTLYRYNEAGEQEYVCIDLDRDDTIDFDGADSVTCTVQETAEAHDTIVRRTISSVWNTAGVDAATTNSVWEQSANGRKTWDIACGVTNASFAGIDGIGNRTNTQYAADGAFSETLYQTGRVVRVTRKDAQGNQITRQNYAYDPHGRLATVTDLRSGVTSFTYDDLDRRTAVSVCDGQALEQTTQYHYDPMGRVTNTVHPDGLHLFREYHPTGELKKEYGARTYPAEYTYDYAGRMKTLTTWQNFAADSGKAVTTWNYDANRGWLVSKQYEDDSGPTYEYTPAGRLAQRTWARGVATVYTNDNAGRLVGIGYTNGTPDVVFVYDRAGRPIRASSSVAAYGFRYDGCGRLDGETNSVADAILIRSYDAFGRPSGLSLASDYEVDYGYDSAGRFAAVTGTVASATSVANYGYVADSDLLAGYAAHVVGSPASLNVSRTYDNLGRTLFVSNTVGGTTVSAYGYQYNTANQRTRIDVGGSATPLSGSWWEHGYDSLGQVTNSVRRLADSTAVSGQRFGYVFDDIGNRVLAEGSDAASAETYAANDLNQYTQRSVPRRVDVLGSAHSNALVTVRSALAVAGATNYARAMRQGTYFHGVASVPTNAAARLGLDVFAVLGGAGTNGEDAVSVESGVRSVAPDPQVFTYDQDGNLLSDGIFVYAWDAENRLTLASNAMVRVAYAYDPLGRRVSKTVHEWDTDHWSPVTDRSFVYNGWAMIRESSTTVTNLYVYGLDLSGTIQGAGTIGGLLLADLNGEAAFYAYDANGNVTDLIAPDGEIRARYEYSPFGETLIQTGPLASANPFRFSTKYLDAETGCYYYGYRLYIPPLGRWANRDPIGEGGGVAIYAFVANAPMVAVDVLGLASSRESAPGPAEQCASMCCILYLLFQYGDEYEIRSVANDADLRRDWAKDSAAEKSASRARSVYERELNDVGLGGSKLYSMLDEVAKAPECEKGIAVIMYGHGSSEEGILYPWKRSADERAQQPRPPPPDGRIVPGNVSPGTKLWFPGLNQPVSPAFPGGKTWNEGWKNVRAVHARVCYSDKSSSSFPGQFYTGYPKPYPLDRGDKEGAPIHLAPVVSPMGVR